jgi:hypothetical protein
MLLTGGNNKDTVPGIEGAGYSKNVPKNKVGLL